MSTVDLQAVEGAEPDPGFRNAPLRSAAAYAVGGALPRAISFLLLPLYTRAIDPSQYGTLSLLLAISSAVAIALTLGLDYAVFRTYFQLEHDRVRQRELVDSLWKFLVVFPTSAALIVGAVAWPLIGSAGRIRGLDLLLALLAAALNVAATTLPLAVLRAEQRLRGYLTITVTTAASSAALTLLFVVVLHRGVRGWLLGMLIANALGLATAAIVVPWHRSDSYRHDLVRGSIRFGLPLVPHFLSHWALQLADRAVLAALVSGSALGAYSFGANLALPVMILVQALNQGFMPMYARAGAGRHHLGELSDAVVLQAAAVTLITTAGALLGPPLVRIVAPASYGNAAPVVAWIVLGYGFLGLYYIPMNGVSLAAGRTRFVAVATGFSAAINLGLLFLFVPNHGIRAAAIASAVGYGALVIAIFFYSLGADNPTQYRWRTLVTTFFVGAAAFAGATLTTSSTSEITLAVHSAWLVVATVAVAFVLKVDRRRA
jgi:O-antigen/teichoic acid export membrane protein